MSVTISATLVKELREATNVGMMECKKALQDAGGDKEKAFQLLRERGLAMASKKAERTAKDGLIDATVNGGGKTGAMIEVNCETDFVARNETFKAFVSHLLQKALAKDQDLTVLCKDEVAAKIAEIGENLILRRHVRYQIQGPGCVASYVHLGGKVGVLVQVACGKEATVQQEAFKTMVKDITLHIAFANPHALDRAGIDAATIDNERHLFAKQAEGKPANVVEKIVDGKINKFFSQVCLLEQAFVKDSDISVSELLARTGKELGDTLRIEHFVRYEIGA